MSFSLVDIMLRAGLNTCRLQAEDGLVCSDTGQERVCAETFPVASALGHATKVHHGTEGDVDPFADVFLTHRNATCAE
jgi:hypothetical protein